jgi:transposase
VWAALQPKRSSSLDRDSGEVIRSDRWKATRLAPAGARGQSSAKVIACVVDGESGEMTVHRLPGETAAVVAFCAGLPRPTRVAYEAGPTGFGLARALVAAGVECVVRAREDLRGDLMRARHGLSKLLLRHDIRYDDTASRWGRRHREWLARIDLGHPGAQLTLTEYVGAIDALEIRRQGAITKSGSRHARRLLVEAAWH